MNKRMLVGCFGAVVVALLMVSSATAINVVQTNKMKESFESESYDDKDDLYVDPNLHLTRNHLPILKRAIRNMEDDQYKEVVQRIIDLVERQGTVDSGDVRQIIDDTDARITRVHFSGFISGTAAIRAFEYGW